MPTDRCATITGTGAYLPEKVLTNSDLEKMVDTSDAWIRERTGISERRLASNAEFTSTMGVRAAKQALERAGISSRDIGAIIVSTMTPDYFGCPSTASLIQHDLGATNAACLDIQAACSGFLYGLSIAKCWVEAGVFETVLFVASEKNSAFIDYEDRNTCVLFGDGSGACVVSRGKPGYAIRHVCLGADGEQAQLLTIPAGGSRMPASRDTAHQKLHYIKMNGKEIFKHAVRRVETSIQECLEQAKIDASEVRWLIPHQANIRIMEAIAKRFDIPWERVRRTIDKYGNTSSATIPITLAELDAEHTLDEGDPILLAAFGGGLTWGSVLLRRVNGEPAHG